MFTTYYSKKFDKEFNIRSDLELQYILEVESDDKSIRLDYEFLKKDIKYRYKGKTHYYIPDFIIQYTDGSTYLIEVKPKDLVKDIINQKKFKAQEAR